MSLIKAQDLIVPEDRQAFELLKKVFDCRPQARQLAPTSRLAETFINSACAYQAGLRNYLARKTPKDAVMADHVATYHDLGEQLSQLCCAGDENTHIVQMIKDDLLKAEFNIVNGAAETKPLLDKMLDDGKAFIEYAENRPGRRFVLGLHRILGR